MREASSKPSLGLRRLCEVTMAAHQSHWNFSFTLSFVLVCVNMFLNDSPIILCSSSVFAYAHYRTVIVGRESSSVLPRYPNILLWPIELELVLVRT